MMELWNKIKGGGITVTGITSGVVGFMLLQFLNARGANITNEELVAALSGLVITIGVVRRVYVNYIAVFAVLLLGAACLTTGCSTFQVEFSDTPQMGTQYKSSLHVAPFGKLGEGIAAMGYNWDAQSGEISVGQNVKDVDNTAQVEIVRIAVEAAIMAAQMYATGGASAALPRSRPAPAPAPAPAPTLLPAPPTIIEVPPPPVEPEGTEEGIEIPEVEDEQ